MENEKTQKQPKRKWVMNVIIIIVAIVFLASLGYNIYLLANLISRKNYDKYIKKLETIKNDSGVSALSSTNSDIVAWLTCEDQSISVPIVKTETTKDEDFYADHDIKKRKNSLGVPYITHNTNVEQNITTIVGHSGYDVNFFGKKTNKKMFANFNNYLTTFGCYNYEIKLETATETRTYKIFALISFSVKDDYEAENKVFQKTNFSSQADFDSFISDVKTLSKVKFDETPVFGDKILTLFTCSENLNYRTMILANQIS